jgi:conjugative relaxase-like TrwC/TraI family protein
VPAEEIERLRESRKAPSTRQGYDVVFRPAKGWSVLWAVGSPELRLELRRIHHQAVDDALDYLEDTAGRGRATVAWRDRRVRVRARGDGFVVACFDHRESRAGDPLLHTHCLIANVTRLPDGRLGALEASGLFWQQRAADAVYRATFVRLASQRLGIRPAPGDDPFPEPEGVPRPVIDYFSKRSDEISEEVARHGSASAAARQLAALATRRTKEVATRSDDLHSRWRGEAEVLGFGEAELSACLGHPEVPVPTDAQVAALELALAAPEGLTEKGATFFRGDAVRALADGLPGAMSGPEIVAEADAFLASNAVIQVREHRPGRPRGRLLEAGGVVDDLAVTRFSVPELADAEARLMGAAERTSGPTIDEDIVEDVLGRLTHLSMEQADMVRSVCKSTALLRPVVGLPGSGKTTAAAALVASCHAAAIPVVGCAVTATAADELGRRTGLAACDTLARTLADLQVPDGGLAAGTVVLADEASMLPTRALGRLIDHVEAVGGTLILIGDPHQHPAVGPGSFFAWLTSRRETPTLVGNLRQVGGSATVEHEAAALLREGDVAASLQLRDEAGLVTRASTHAQLHDRLVADWQRDWQRTRDPMIAASNETRERLNLTARRLLGSAGVLHGPVWRSSSGREFQAGDWVVARHNDRRLRSPGDRRFWVRNGACGEVVGVDGDQNEIVVDFAGSDDLLHRVRLPRAYVDAHLEHAYALTDYGVQGRTLTRSLAVLEEASTTPGTYVATTRGRFENRIYLADGDLIDEEGLDTSHGIPRLSAPTMQESAARVAARRPDGMLHDHDGNVRQAAELAGGTDLQSLHEMLHRLDRELSNLPGDASKALESALAARRNLAAGAQRSGSPSAAKLASRLTQLEASIRRLEAQQSRRVDALERRDSQLAMRSLVADAVALRMTKDRLAPPSEEPDLPRIRKWAAERH